MAPRKRKAETYLDDQDDWLPAINAPPYHSYPSGPGSSSNPIVLDSPPAQQPKRQRKTKTVDSDVPLPEKRGAIMKKKCPKNILERLGRVREQRFFMVNRKREGDALREEFQVLGSTGNVYTIAIDKFPTCNCPDALKGNHCKHILFVYTKVLQVPYASHVWYQKALLTTELEEIFAEAPPAPNDLAHPHVREAYEKATGQKVASGSQGGGPKKRIPAPDTDCPICYEDMHGTSESQLSFCDSCGNCLHQQCFDQWANTAKTKGTDLTCVYCRAKPKPVAGGSRARGAQISEGYLNLANAAGLSPVRDTSSYYHGPRRGQSFYGYQCYR